MQSRWTNQMPIDEVVLCDARGDCIEARGENGRILIGAAVIVLALIGLSIAWKKR